jgi:DNA polymerase III epsilon subunit-like protein
MYLIFDIETTGLPIFLEYNKFPNPKESHLYENSRIIEIGYIIIDENFQIVLEKSALTKTDLHITNEHIHGITDEILKKEGQSLKHVLIELNQNIENFKVDTIIAHNIQFDYNIVLSEIFRYLNSTNLTRYSKKVLCGLKTNLYNMNQICTMKEGRKLTGKNPKLKDLYEKLFNVVVSQTHRALDDVKLCVGCWIQLNQLTLQI